MARRIHAYTWRRKLNGVGYGLICCLLLCAWVTGGAANAPSPTTPASGVEDEVTLTLTDEGFTPATLTRTAGRFLLSVDNRSAAEALTLRLDREGGGQVREIKVTANTVGWAEELDLTAGSYTLTEAQHPQWVCRITLQ